VRRRELPTRVRAHAPTRLDFAGAWTDVPPFSAREGGVVVNGAIALRAEVELDIGGTLIRLEAEDTGAVVECVNAGGLVRDGRLELHKAALRMFPVQGNLTLRTRSAAPPGSGLGGSGALDVALIACLAYARAEHWDARELAEHAWHLEAVEAGLPGGRQDQQAAAYGGFHRFTFRDPDVGVEPITLEPAFADTLARHLVLCYTGESRASGGTIARVAGAYDQGDRGVTGALRALKDLAGAMAEALRAGDLAAVGRILSQNWGRQLELDPGMRTPAMARLEQALSGAGSLGGKAAGAGAGGSMFFVAGDDVAGAIAAAREAGATVLPVAWAWEGGRAW
jgi:D-glycero-alpha-D-manno-heptose-7-phosphate kinase